MSVIRSIPVGCGHYLPEKILTNADLSKIVDTSDKWIQSRSGILERHIAAEGEFTSDLAIAAARAALADAELTGADVDLIVLATATPDKTFPASAAKVQSALGMRHGFAFDVHAVCSGFMYALATADNFIRTGQVRTALIIGAETFSRIIDWTDRATCVLFGDGAGAIVLRAGAGNGDTADRGVLTTHLHSDGDYCDILYVDGGPSTTQTTGHLRMRGREVFRHAVENLADVAHEAMEALELTGADIDWIVPHQANRRIIESTARRAGVSMDKVIVTVGEHGNTSAASIPLALSTAIEQGRIRPGQLLLMEAMGGGLTWGSAIIRW